MIRPRHVQFGPMTFVQAANRIGVTLFVGVIITLMHQYLWLGMHFLKVLRVQDKIGY